MKEINERIKTAEKKLVAALKKRVSSIDSDYNTYINVDIWCNGCVLGRLHRINENIRDVNAWAWAMVCSVGEEIVPFLGGIWRMLDHFESHAMSFQLTEEVFNIISSLQQINPKITAGTVFEQLYVKSKKAYQMLRYINAIYAGWEEYKHPTFITQQIKDALEAGEISSDLPAGVDKIEFSLQKFSYGPACEPCDVASIFVNGRSFRMIIEEAELPSAARNGKPEEAGGYAWLTVGELLEELRELRDLNDENYIEPRIMDCGCGCSECWPLYVKIKETDLVWLL
ncbi:MAG: hypothetical protein IJG43_01355 [Acidaminococcaceae bacterium]|nr:hypothetical protein [Acidaminococcaceae bacterium]